jgi:NodT family efflux transporter outer membrane factor (OMF) lipoprotein
MCCSTLALGACVVGPSYVPPEAKGPDAWREDLERGLEPGAASLEDWWARFGDAKLDDLIRRARAGNYDLDRAVARIYQARAVRGVSKSERMPDADGVGGVTRAKVSEENDFFNQGADVRSDTRYETGLDSTWEMDLFGRITRSIESADAGLQASVEDYRDVLVSIYAEVAATYIELRALQARIRFALANVQAQSGTLQLTEDRRDAGIGSELDVAQAQLNLATTQALVPRLREQAVTAVHALGVLIGQSPGALRAELDDAVPIPKPPGDIRVGIPADLLRQRPDIRQAERQLAAQNARIGVATADLYPRFSLTGMFSVNSLGSAGFLTSGSLTYNFGPTVRWNLFDGGRVRQVIALEDAKTRNAYAEYEQTVLQGQQEVEDAIAGFVYENVRRDALDRSVVAARKSVELVTVLYRTGLTDFQNVLDMQRSLFRQEDALANSEGLVDQNLVRLYKALGGGWTSP